MHGIDGGLPRQIKAKHKSSVLTKSTNLKVVHIITGLGNGGAEAVLSRLCTHDHRARHIVVSLSDFGIYGAHLKEAGIEVHAVGLSKNPFAFFRLIHLVRFLRSARPDIVQTWMYHSDLIGGIAARIAGVRAVVWGIHHSTLVAGSSKASTIAISRLCAVISTWVPARILCCANRAREVHVAMGYSAQIMRVVPNGYDFEVFRYDAVGRDRLRLGFGVKETDVLIGTVGRFDPLKDHRNLITAVGHLKVLGRAFRLLLIGPGMTSSNIEIVEWIAAAGLTEDTILAGSRSDIPAVMSALDLHVLPSRGEAFPNVLVESMGCETPCVTTDVGDAALMVGELGWVVPPRDPQALANAINAALTLRHNDKAWGERRKAVRSAAVARFGIEHMVNSYHGVWAEARQANVGVTK
jgi:glycosyltransferase involved in cell wall biosynthesis